MRVLLFDGNGGTRWGEQPSVPPGKGQVRIRSLASLISHGTERLVLEGGIPEGMGLDANLSEMSAPPTYPLRYGYSLVGLIEELDPSLPLEVGQRVFAFAPHGPECTIDAEAIVPLPDDLSTEDAVFLAQTETALSLVLDLDVKIGQRVVVVGLGTVGLLASLLIQGIPLVKLELCDVSRTARARAAKLLGPDPTIASAPQRSYERLLELTGRPDALNAALPHAAFGARMVIGSWYGSRGGRLSLGADFHRKHIALVSSQVSNLSPLQAAWLHKAQRMALVLDALATLRPSRLEITYFPFSSAHEAYAKIVEQPDCSQCVLRYDSNNGREP